MKITPIHLGAISCNCYLIQNDSGFILIDTGMAAKWGKLRKALEKAGCTTTNLRAIIMTHGDFDHTGNGAFLHREFGARIIMHPGDSGMVEHGDMFWNRETGSRFVRKIVNVLFGIIRFKPDTAGNEGFDLSGYGMDARIVHIPGHSKGSIGVLTAEGDLFCGDLFCNTGKPELNPIMDDIEEASRSLQKLRGLNIRMVYPGHGKPFVMGDFETQRQRR